MKNHREAVETQSQKSKISYRILRLRKYSHKVASRFVSRPLLWSTLTVVCLAINLSLLIDLVSRFWGGAPGTLSVLAIIVQSLVTLISGGSLSAPGRKIIRRLFSAVSIKKRFWSASEFGLSILAFTFLLFFRLSLGGISVLYNNHGVKQYAKGRVRSAESSFNMALRLNSGLSSAYGNLGRIYDDQQDYESAKHQYVLASHAGDILSYSKLARLHIIEGEEDSYAQAIYLLARGLSLEKKQSTSERTKYSLLKNMGWARLNQKSYKLAEMHLTEAIEILPMEAPAHCLYAQTLDRTDRPSKALQHWQKCLDYASSCKRDEDRWIGLANDRLRVDNIKLHDCLPEKFYSSGGD